MSTTAEVKWRFCGAVCARDRPISTNTSGCIYYTTTMSNDYFDSPPQKSYIHYTRIYIIPKSFSSCRVIAALVSLQSTLLYAHFYKLFFFLSPSCSSIVPGQQCVYFYAYCQHLLQHSHLSFRPLSLL
jgi:hypothetical protein